MRTALLDLINSLRNRKFTKKLRGYDPVEVHAYLKRVSNQLDELSSEIFELRGKLKKSEVELVEYREREDLFKRTLSNATQMSEKIKEDTTKESRLILSDAQHRAEVITRDAKDSLRKIYQDISELRRIRLQFENNIKAVLNSHLTMLEQGERMLPNPVVDESKLKMDMKEIEPQIINLEEDSQQASLAEEMSSNTSSPEMDL